MTHSKTKRKGDVVEYVSSDTIVSDIVNGIVSDTSDTSVSNGLDEVPWTDSKVTLVSFDYYLFKKWYILGIPWIPLDYQIVLLFLIWTIPHSFMEVTIASYLHHRLVFFMDIHEVSKCRSVKQYIYDYEKVVFLKCFKSLVSKALIYVPTW